MQTTNKNRLLEFNKERVENWEIEAERSKRSIFSQAYQNLLKKRYRFHIPEGHSILELGCGKGDLLASLKPKDGVGVDFSGKMIKSAQEKHPQLIFLHKDAHCIDLNRTFDYIIISDLLNDIWDVQTLLKTVSTHASEKTRLIINSHSHVWKPILSWASKLRLVNHTLQQNWLTNQDIRSLLEIEEFEVIKTSPEILLPLPIPFIEPFFNRFLSKLKPFRWFDVCNFTIAKKRHNFQQSPLPSVSVIIAARNEEGNIEDLILRTPQMGSHTEIIFVEGGSSDNTYSKIESEIKNNPSIDVSLYRQPGVGKGDAVRLGFNKAKNDILMILDADMTVSPEDLPKFYEAIVNGNGEFINGVRLVYPMHKDAMRFFNIIGNKFFSSAFTWILGQPVKDTLCGTKVLTKENYQKIADNRSYFGDFDPFGDFDLIFGAAKQNLKIVDMPIRYGERTYGDTNIDRWKAGVLLLRMSIFAAKRLKFI